MSLRLWRTIASLVRGRVRNIPFITARMMLKYMFGKCEVQVGSEGQVLLILVEDGHDQRTYYISQGSVLETLRANPKIQLVV